MRLHSHFVCCLIRNKACLSFARTWVSGRFVNGVYIPHYFSFLCCAVFVSFFFILFLMPIVASSVCWLYVCKGPFMVYLKFILTWSPCGFFGRFSYISFFPLFLCCISLLLYSLVIWIMMLCRIINLDILAISGFVLS